MTKIILYVIIAMYLVACSPASKVSSKSNGLNERFYPSKLVHTDLREVNFKDKFIIIDFWATWCAPCIKGFSHFETLASTPKFKDNAVFVLLSEEEEQKILKRLNGRTLQNVHFAIDQSDSLLGKTFEKFDVQYLPYAVVIHPNGELLWSGGTYSLTDSKLEHLIAGTYQEAPPKPKKATKQTVIADTLTGAHYQITTCLANKGSSSGFTKKDQSGYKRTAVSIRNLVKDLSNRSNFNLVSDANIDSTVYYVHFKCDPDSIEQPFNFLLHKLLAHYNIQTSTYTAEKEVFHVTVLNSDLLARKTTLQVEDGHGGFDYTDNEIVIINKPITTLVSILNELDYGPLILKEPLNTETRYDFQIDLKEGISGIKNQLEKKYGLGLVPTTTPIEVIKIQP